MLIYLDTNIVIYLIEQPPNWGPRAAARIATIRSNADQIVLSDLHRLECRVNPLAAGDAARLAHFDAFFASSEVRVMPLSAAVCHEPRRSAPVTAFAL